MDRKKSSLREGSGNHMKKVLLQVKGSSWERGELEKTTDITGHEDLILIFSDLFEMIRGKGKHNWTFETELERDESEKSGWKTVRKIYKMYPGISRDVLDRFYKCVPYDSDTISEILILTSEVNKII